MAAGRPDLAPLLQSRDGRRIPSREHILACQSPAELFGQAASDPRELKRAYARLVRAYRAEEDPDVFQHVRALYDAAREAPPEPAPGQPPPVQRLREALIRGDPPAVLGLLQSDAQALIADDAPAVSEGLRLLVLGAGPALGEGALDVVDLVLARPDLPLHPDDAEELAADVLTLRALRSAAADPEVPEPLVLALRRGWRRRADLVAQAWLEAASAMDPEALDPAVSHLEVRHPAVLSLLQRQELRLIGATEAPDLPPAEVAELRRRLPPTMELHQRVLQGWPRLLLSGGGHFLLYMVGLIAAILAGAPLILAIAAGIGLRWIVKWWLTSSWLPVRIEAWHEALHPGDREPLLALARGAGAWPHEVASAVAPQAPLPVDAQRYAYVAGHPLLELRRDAAATLKVLTERHVKRVRRAVEAQGG